MDTRRNPAHVSIIALPESMATPIHGLYETLRMVELVASDEAGRARAPLFDVEIVGPYPGILHGACGLPVKVHRATAEVRNTDIVITTSIFLDAEWIPGRYPETVVWLRDMHRRGAKLYSACAGALLLAETGLLDGLEATTHWAFASTFRRNFPRVRLRPEASIVTTGRNRELVMSGAASSWQDLILHLIARHASPAIAENIGRFLLYTRTADTPTPYFCFGPRSDHGDAVIRRLQAWVQENHSVACPVETLARRSGLPGSSFKRRFKSATGYSPLQYVQHLRVEEAKRLLERSDMPVDEICRAVGYEEPAFFRRLFKRITHTTPARYRRQFRFPAPA